VSSLLALFDAELRYAATFPDLRREELPHLVRQVDLLGKYGTVIYSRLYGIDVDAAIQQQMDYFAGLGQELEWKVFGHDEPPDLVDRLAAHGFQVDETEAVLVLDLQSLSSELPSPIGVRRLAQSSELQEVAQVKQQVYGDGYANLIDRLGYEMTHAPESVSVYIAYADEQPAAVGWIRYQQGTIFAGLWGGSTLPELRNRGFYTTLLTARIEEARDRGVRYVTVDARHTSRPILEKRGFHLLTTATACSWSNT
jgi:hypothetical protein